MKLVIIIPALNEEKTIVSIISGIPQRISNVSSSEVIVVDDGSTDQTAQLARQAGAHVVQHHKNLGVGAAFQTGIDKALERGANIIVNIDADGQFNPADIPALIAPIVRGEAQFATASRFATPETVPAMPAIKLWGNRWMVRIINFLTGKHFTDVSCGFRAFTRNTAVKLTLFGRFTYTQETFIDLARKDIAMIEVPIKVRGVREHGRSRVADNLWRYGIKAAIIIFRAARDHHPFYFFGLPGLAIVLLGIAAGVFLLVHYVRTGQTFPYRNVVAFSGIMLGLGALLVVLSMLADMLQRNRMLVEQTLYLTKKKFYGHDEQDI